MDFSPDTDEQYLLESGNRCPILPRIDAGRVRREGACPTRSVVVLIRYKARTSRTLWTISGTVSDVNGPLQDVVVQVNDGAGGLVMDTVTDGSGAYPLQVPFSGPYYIFTPVQSLPDPTLLPEAWDGADGIYCANCSPFDFAPLMVIEGNTTADFFLEHGGYIGGNIQTAGAKALRNDEALIRALRGRLSQLKISVASLGRVIERVDNAIQQLETDQ